MPKPTTLILQRVFSIHPTMEIYAWNYFFGLDSFSTLKIVQNWSYKYFHRLVFFKKWRWSSLQNYPISFPSNIPFFILFFLINFFLKFGTSFFKKKDDKFYLFNMNRILNFVISLLKAQNYLNWTKNWMDAYKTCSVVTGAHGIKCFVIPTKTFVKIGITKIFCYNNKMFSSISKTFGFCRKIVGCSNKKFICFP